ncbi:hypothetical protein MVES_002949 [Malassezia vespertilionis]|uniref:Uncharacterized protein n=1 Tax=Malassezia vespertilionis TaxID=2020962 RepID=A0A2N1J9P8_9BASI|nr:hypothetical protein MVES_002949 [Malassezia vespertilionis]
MDVPDALGRSSWSEELGSDEDLSEEELPRPVLDQIPPSPGYGADPSTALGTGFWLPAPMQSSERFQLPFGARWALPQGNILWGLGTQKRKSRQQHSYGALDSAPRPAFSPSVFRATTNIGALNPGRNTNMEPIGFRTRAPEYDTSVQDMPLPSSPSVRPKHMFEHAFRPSGDAIDTVLGSWTQRNFVLIWLPVLLVLGWCAMPFPNTRETQMDENFWFFLLWYYGAYVSVGLIFVTQLFTLYRLNWWPSAIGAKTSYVLFWSLSVFCGYLLYRWNPFDSADPEDEQWALKTQWVLLAFATMAMPACVCFVGLRRRGRQLHRTAVPESQQPFVSTAMFARIPASYRRFLWFLSTMALNLLTLLIGQGYAIVYLSTLPHTGLDGTLYVAFWLVTVNVLSTLSQVVLGDKVRSRALQFVSKFFYFMVYFIFYRNLFARLRSFDQFALIQLLSSAWVCLWYPLTMSRTWLRFLNKFNPRAVPWERHAEKMSLFFYLRNMAQHTTMLAFLGWLSLLHFGINRRMYPFFAFDDKDPYNYKLTMQGSLVIWVSECISNWATTRRCASIQSS